MVCGTFLRSANVLAKLLAGAAFALALISPTLQAADIIRVATYNVENYLLAPTETRPEAKSAAAQAKVQESICAMQPDVIALEEIGSPEALLELQTALKNKGLDLPHSEIISGSDTNIHVAFLSRCPIIARHPHTTDEFLLDGRRHQVCRGFAEIEVQARPGFNLTLIAAHLKSRRTEINTDEAEERLAEAKILRRIIDQHLEQSPETHLIVLGDFNDTKDTEAIKTIIGHGRLRLTDTRPAERNGDTPTDASARYQSRDITWTHYYGYADTYSRIDYILISRALQHKWLPSQTYIPAIPNWGLGSDHRPLVAAFDLGELQN